jgi:hypothetical protein
MGDRDDLGAWPREKYPMLPGTELLWYSSASSYTDLFKSLGRISITEYNTAMPTESTRESYLKNVGT